MTPDSPVTPDQYHAMWDLANKLGAAGLVCAIIFIAGLKRLWWRMGPDSAAEIADLKLQLVEIKADRDVRLAKQEKETLEWKTMALQFGGMSERSVKMTDLALSVAKALKDAKETT